MFQMWENLVSEEEKCISLRDCLHPKPLDPPPKPIEWRRSYESVAIQKYVAETSNTTVQKSGFIIHAENGCLGATPDGRVHAKASHSDSILEVKCPYSKREVSPDQACNDSAFCCELIQDEVRLKKSHPYYHQVQL